ncbi:hypothetical protein [Paraclostridium bifermentans]|uniref:hypothetical protein n=1 Tax=Paraclostridium bifermentans TaxID=1490 RepID=UPI00374ECA80
MKKLKTNKLKLKRCLVLTLIAGILFSSTGCTFIRKTKENNFMGNYLNTALPHDNAVDDREGYFDTK